jgi:uncharacterized protein YjbJ (UPF0337 family)
MELFVFTRVGAVASAVEVADMDREHVKRAFEKAKGSVKDAAGKLMDDKEMQAEGKFDKAKGAAHKAAGDVKDRARDAVEDIMDD